MMPSSSTPHYHFAPPPYPFLGLWRNRFGHFLGALLVEEIGYEKSLFVLVGLCFIFVPVGVWGMDE